MKFARDYLRMTPHGADMRKLPRWGHRPDGELVRLEPDNRLIEDFEDWQARSCKHPRRAVVELEDSRGRSLFMWVCKDCATKLSEYINHDVGPQASSGKITREDRRDRSEVYRLRRSAEYEKIIQDAVSRTP